MSEGWECEECGSTDPHMQRVFWTQVEPVRLDGPEYRFILRHDGVVEPVLLSAGALWRFGKQGPESRGPEFVRLWGPRFHTPLPPTEEE